MIFLRLIATPLLLVGLGHAGTANTPSGNTGSPEPAQIVSAVSPLFGHSLAMAVEQLEGKPITGLAPRPVGAIAQEWVPGGPVEPLPTARCKPATMSDHTCQSTCSSFPTCNGSPATQCQSTCGSYPTCTGGTTCMSTCSETGRYPTCNSGNPTSCGQNTCNSYPTCSGTGTMCAYTCGGSQGWPTCNGSTATECTNTCSSGAQQYPTCTASCSSFPTCTGGAGCTQTSAGWATCSGYGGSTCAAGNTCGYTNSGYATCGPSATVCGNTCASHPTACGGATCDRTNCTQGSRLLASLPIREDWPQASLVLALTGLVVTRRKKLEREEA